MSETGRGWTGLGCFPVSANSPRHMGSGLLQEPSAWHTVDWSPTMLMLAKQRKMMEEPRAVPWSMFSSHPFDR